MAKKGTRTKQRDRPAIPTQTLPTRAAPSLIPPALTIDAFSNPLARLGAGTTDMTQYTQYIKQNLTAQYSTLTALYRENPVVKRLIDTVPEDMAKSWYRIKSQLPPDSKQQIRRLERKTRIREKILDGLKWGRLYGGAVAVIVIDGHDDILDQPLDLDMVMPGSFKGLIIVDRWSGVSPSLDIVDDIDDPEFGLPKYYTISTSSFGLGVRVHHSRILRFIGRHLPSIEEISETYWGASELEHVFAEIVKYDNTSHNIASLVFAANLKIYKMDGYEQLATAPQSVQRDLYNTLTLMNWMMNSQGMQIMGKEDDFATNQYSFAGLSDIYEMFMYGISGASEIPVTKLFGRSPAGLNATGKSDMDNYYDSIEEKQEASLRPKIERLLPILCMSEFGAVPDDLDFEFEPIRRPSEEEKRTIGTQTTTSIKDMYNSGIISQKIALKELRESARATGMWNNITDEDIERADDEFGIGGEAPNVMELLARHDTGQEDILQDFKLPSAVEGVTADGKFIQDPKTGRFAGSESSGVSGGSESGGGSAGGVGGSSGGGSSNSASAETKKGFTNAGESGMINTGGETAKIGKITSPSKVITEVYREGVGRLAVVPNSPITNIATIAGGSKRTVKQEGRLLREYGGKKGKWKKLTQDMIVNVDGEHMVAEIHSFYEPTLGYVEQKIKAFR